MKFCKLVHAVIAALVAIQISAHPDLSVEEMVEYKRHVARGAEALGHCLQSSEMQEHNKRMAAERSEVIRRLRKARGLATTGPKDNKEAFKKYNAIDHWQHGNDRKTKDPQDLFNFKWNDDPNAKPLSSAILTPESIPGPYWHEGHPQRQNITSDQNGIYLRLAMQVLDVSSCRPVKGARVDLWHANAIGTYSNTAGEYLRGWQPSSSWGTVDFDTIWPGHYGGRATHVHVAVHPWESKHVIHVGQVYFDEFPREWIEQTSAYRGNPNNVTKNIDDLFAPEAATDDYDPFTKWEFFSGEDKINVNDGVLAWITLGVDMTADVDQLSNQKRSFLTDHLEH